MHFPFKILGIFLFVLKEYLDLDLMCQINHCQCSQALPFHCLQDEIKAEFRATIFKVITQKFHTYLTYLRLYPLSSNLNDSKQLQERLGNITRPYRTICMADLLSKKGYWILKHSLQFLTNEHLKSFGYQASSLFASAS